ncbi:MAG: hypothetical protein AAGI01_07070 [Myxococcota bacterium]
MKKNIAGTTLEVVTESDELSPHLRVSSAGDGAVARATRVESGVRGRARPWKDGYQGEHTSLEHAYLRGLELITEAEERLPEHLVIGALPAAREGWPGEPSAFVVLNAMARLIHERPGELHKISLVIDAADTRTYERAFDEFVDTMIGTT